MRSVLARGLLSFGSLLLVSAVAEPAHAEGSMLVSRRGAPWLRVGGSFGARLDKAVSAETRGRSVLASQVKAGITGLVSSGTDRFGDGDTIVRYAQTHHGLPVIGKGASVRFGANGQAKATVVDMEDVLPETNAPAVSADRAASFASSATAFRATARESHLVVWPTVDRGARLAYVVLPHVPAGIPSKPRVIVDAQTGEILQRRDMLTYAKANVYEFNPTKTPTPSVRDLALPPGATLTNEFISSANCIDKKAVRDVDMFGFALKVHVCDIEQVATANGSGDFDYDPADQPGSAEARTDAFSEVSIYYHAAKAYEFFRDLQGDPTAQVVTDKPLRLIANLQIPAGMMSGNLTKAANPDIPLETFQNAFFSPASGGLGEIFNQLYGFDSGALWFGQGPKRDYSYDGDVVYHEFGHAVVDHTIHLEAWHVDAFGAIDAPGAMNEGLADYFSSAITGDSEVGEYAATDLGGGGDAIRSLVNSDKCPTAVTGEVHYDSTLFSGGLWQARQSLPEGDRSKFDAAIYKALRSNPGEGDLGYDDLTKLFLATLSDDLPSGAKALEKAMTDHGVLPSCDRVLPFEKDAIQSPFARYGFASPGKQSVNVKGTAPGILQVRAALPPNTTEVTVTFSSREGGSPTDMLGGASKPFAPVVLGKLGSPIKWDPKSKAGHDATLKEEAKGDSDREVTFVIPEGSTDDSIYIQIANTGDTDGAYDDIALSFTTKPGTEAEGEPPPAEEPSSSPSSTSGCSATPGGTSMLSCVGVGLSTLLAAARRRSRKR